MIDIKVLKFFGTSNEQLRTFFTAKPPASPAPPGTPADPLYERKTKFSKWVSSLIEDGRRQCIKNYKHFASVDLMMDSQPILQENIPLMAYAQGKIEVKTVEKELTTLSCAEKFIETKKIEGETPVKKVVNVARLQEVCVNVGRSFLSRRANAQSNKYNALRPAFKYETRGTEMTDHVKSEAMSQYAEIMADNFGYRHEQNQAIRAMFNYRTVVFPAGAWEVETQTHIAPEDFNGTTVEGEIDGQKLKLRTRIEREGVRMVRPNPARVLYDTSQPLSGLNTDLGPKWVGFWDVQRFGDIERNADFFNRDSITWNNSGISILDQNRAYFDLVFAGAPMNFPTATLPLGAVDLAAQNERKGNSFVYSVDADAEKAVFVTDMRCRLVPKEWGLGEYPHPLWLRLLVAGDETVIFAEWLPSLPAIYFGHNEDDTRLLNISTAHEIMPWQDQLSNIFSQLLMKMKHALFRVILVNTDVIGPAIVKALRENLDSPRYYINPHLLEVSFNQEAKELGLDLDKCFRVIGAAEGTNANESEYINNAFKAIIQILAIMERLLNMSPQEQGQPAPREITAEEVAAIESTTQATYNAIGTSIDEARAAWKRIIYEAAMAHASEEAVHLPVSQRFTKATIEKAGFTVVSAPEPEGSTAKRGYTVIGTKTKLVHNYVFTSRDGGDRSSNRESAQILQQFLVGILPVIGPEALGKQRIFDIVNEMFRLLSSYDLKLEVHEGDNDAMMAPSTEEKISAIQNQVGEKLAELQKVLSEHEGEISGLGDAVQKISDFIKEQQLQMQQQTPAAPAVAA